jgi:KDO2-lipid IV(A) lauroyltransferase
MVRTDALSNLGIFIGSRGLAGDAILPYQAWSICFLNAADNPSAKRVESLKPHVNLVPTTLLQKEFFKPKYWLTWVGIALIWFVCLLPLRVRWAIGSALGVAAYLLAHRRRRVVSVNLQICFPELNHRQLRRLLIDNFRSSGISIIETALVWFQAPKKFESIVTIHGLENLTTQSGGGVLLLGMHLSTLDFCGAVLATRTPFDIMYRRNKNKLLEAVMTRGRQRNFLNAIERRNIRGVIKSLKRGNIIWYGPDQDYGRKHSVFAPFFNVPAATITATARIVKMTGARVVLFSHYRNLETGRYDIYLKAVPSSEFPTGDEVTDSTTVNALIETAIRYDPSQYWWLHRRFKTQPKGEPRPYDVIQG